MRYKTGPKVLKHLKVRRKIPRRQRFACAIGFHLSRLPFLSVLYIPTSGTALVLAKYLLEKEKKILLKSCNIGPSEDLATHLE